MSTIRVIYHPNIDGSRRDPGFPATEQHPDAVRYPIDHPKLGALNVDALGGATTIKEIDDLLNPPAVTSAETLESRMRAQAINDLDAEIAKMPAGQQPALRAIQTLLKG